jgi:hypothetical protein
MAKAPVLPDPVSARPITSRPSSAAGMASCWIPVGDVHPIALQASQTALTTPCVEETRVCGHPPACTLRAQHGRTSSSKVDGSEGGAWPSSSAGSPAVMMVLWVGVHHREDVRFSPLKQGLEDGAKSQIDPSSHSAAL